ncbi:hypothetical protein D3C72_2005480 [compost metagenome]
MGSVARRDGLVMANTLTLPASACGMPVATMSKNRSTSPLISAGRAWVAPLNGTCRMSMPARSLNSSPARCDEVPGPNVAKVSLPGFCLA